MQICVWRLVGNISFSQIAFVGEPFSLTTVTRFLWGKEKSGVGPKGPGHFYATYRVELFGPPYKFSYSPIG